MALGESAVSDEYDGYRPSAELDMAALTQAFVRTRAETVALANRAANLPESVTAPHNDMGDISMGAWLVYLNGRADRETKRRLRGVGGACWTHHFGPDVCPRARNRRT
jgi:hypothetical protein